MEERGGDFSVENKGIIKKKINKCLGAFRRFGPQHGWPPHFKLRSSIYVYTIEMIVVFGAFNFRRKILFFGLMTPVRELLEL